VEAYASQVALTEISIRLVASRLDHGLVPIFLSDCYQTFPFRRFPLRGPLLPGLTKKGRSLLPQTPRFPPFLPWSYGRFCTFPHPQIPWLKPPNLAHAGFGLPSAPFPCPPARNRSCSNFTSLTVAVPFVPLMDESLSYSQ